MYSVTLSSVTQWQNGAMPRKPLGDRPMTQSERARKSRENRANAGISELRACFVPTELHAEVKALVAEWLAQRKRKN